MIAALARRRERENVPSMLLRETFSRPFHHSVLSIIWQYIFTCSLESSPCGHVSKQGALSFRSSWAENKNVFGVCYISLLAVFWFLGPFFFDEWRSWRYDLSLRIPHLKTPIGIKKSWNCLLSPVISIDVLTIVSSHCVTKKSIVIIKRRTMWERLLCTLYTSLQANLTRCRHLFKFWKYSPANLVFFERIPIGGMESGKHVSNLLHLFNHSSAFPFLISLKINSFFQTRKRNSSMFAYTFFAKLEDAVLIYINGEAWWIAWKGRQLWLNTYDNSEQSSHLCFTSWAPRKLKWCKW